MGGNGLGWVYGKLNTEYLSLICGVVHRISITIKAIRVLGNRPENKLGPDEVSICSNAAEQLSGLEKKNVYYTHIYIRWLEGVSAASAILH